MTQEEQYQKVEKWTDKAEIMLNEFFTSWIKDNILALRDDGIDNRNLQEILFNTLNYNLACGRALQVKDTPEQWNKIADEITEHLRKQFFVSLGIKTGGKS